MIKNKETVVRNLFTIIAFILILIIEGCFSFLTLKWEWAVLGLVTFWVGIATRVLLQILARSASLNTFLPVARNKNEDLKNEKLTNTRLMKLKDSGFPKWVESILNIFIRKDNWKIQTNKKLSKLEKHAKYKDRALWLTDDSQIVRVKKKTYTALELKAKNKYCRKKKEYLMLLDDKFIDDNILNLPVKHCPFVDPALFDIPVTNVSNTDKYQLVAKTKQAILWTLVFAALTMTVTTTIKNALQFGYNKDTLITALVSMLVDVLFLIWQVISSLMDAFKIINNQEVVPYVNRNRILTQYVEYKCPNDKKDVLNTMLEKMKE